MIAVEYLTTAEVLEFLKLPKNSKTFWNLVKNDRTFPKPFRLSPRKFRWSKQEICDWLEQQRGKK